MIVPGVLKSKVFLGCIPSTVEESHVRGILCQYGKLIGFFYSRDMINSDRGFCFATFSSEDEARNCVSELAGKEIFENSIRPIQIKLSCEKITHVDAGSVFIDSGRLLPSMYWEEYVSDEGYPYYYNRETGETVWEKPKYFVKQAAIEEVSIEKLAGTSFVNIPPAGSLGFNQNSGYGPLGANLFIFHVPAEWKDEELKQKFEPYGQLVSCRVSTEDSGRSRGFGFVSYSTRESAASAIQGMNGYPVGGKYLKVTVKQDEEEYALPVTTTPLPNDPVNLPFPTNTFSTR
jgi:CUG-BP- and ETR3-like factor